MQLPIKKPVFQFSFSWFKYMIFFVLTTFLVLLQFKFCRDLFIDVINAMNIQDFAA